MNNSFVNIVFSNESFYREELEEMRIILLTSLLESIKSEIKINILKQWNTGYFYQEEHKIIFEAMQEMYESQTPIDLMTLTTWLRKNKKLDKAGGPSYPSISSLSLATLRLDHIHAIHVAYVQNYAVNKLNQVYYEIVINLNDPEEVTKVLHEQVSIIMNQSSKSRDKVSEFLPEYIQTKEDIITGKVIPYLSTGFKQVDKSQNGLTNGEMIVIAARPGMGKTAYLLSIVLYNLLEKRPVLIFSLEMKKNKVIDRIISAMTNINGQRLIEFSTLNAVELSAYYSAIEKLKTLPLYIIDDTSIDSAKIKNLIKFYVEFHSVQIVGIDYLQLITENSNLLREQEISRISRAIKASAQNNNIPIIALSQLSRAVESRPDKEPKLHDLRESGSIEQDADVVSMLYRPAYYGVTSDEKGNDLTNIVKVIQVKTRNGNQGHVFLNWNKYSATMKDTEIKVINHQQTEIF